MKTDRSTVMKSNTENQKLSTVVHSSKSCTNFCPYSTEKTKQTIQPQFSSGTHNGKTQPDKTKSVHKNSIMEDGSPVKCDVTDDPKNTCETICKNVKCEMRKDRSTVMKSNQTLPNVHSI